MSRSRASNLRGRFRGALLGLAAGDAIGTTVEFKPRGTFPRVTEIMGGGPFRLAPGQWTDDTSMALCLTESLTQCGGFDPADQMDRYLRWYEDGHWSSTGRCFDIGNATRAALNRYRADPSEPFAGSTDPNSAGNGSLMRLAPVPLYYHSAPGEAIRRAADSSRTTHAATVAVDACRYMSALIVGALAGAAKQEILSSRYAPPGSPWNDDPLAPEIDRIAAGSYLELKEPEIRATGYAAHTLEAALWAFARTGSFRDGCLLAVNLGDDADTTGAVYGQLAGAYYGAGGIPADWLERLAMRDEIEGMADRLLEASRDNGGPEPEVSRSK